MTAPQVGNFVTYYDTNAPQRALPAMVVAVRKRDRGTRLCLDVFRHNTIDSVTQIYHRSAATAEDEGFWEYEWKDVQA